MTPDVSLETAKVWRKAIPEARNRMQSRLLVGAMSLILFLLCILMVRYLLTAGHRGGAYLRLALPISLVFALGAWRLRAATAPAAVCGGVICLLITVFSGPLGGNTVFHSGLTPLFLLFVLTFSATKLAKKHKAGYDPDDESRKGRDSAQIIANLGVAAMFSPLWILQLGMTFGGPSRIISYFLSVFAIPMLAALAEAAADTVSSEIGQAFGGRPFLLTALRRVEPGTDGAISLLGTGAGIGAALLIAATGGPALGMALGQWSLAFAAGVGGLFFDSLLGATLEKSGYFGNNLVNFASTLFSALLAAIAVEFFFPLMIA